MYVRCVSEDIKKRGSGFAVITPGDDILDYFTQQPLDPLGRAEINRKTALVRLLAKPGDYGVQFAATDGSEHLVAAIVRDPVDEAVSTQFRDGMPLWYRDGKHDIFIINEQPYRKLPIAPGDVVLDCGAHIGTFTRDAFRRGAASVIAYEPEPVNFRLLEKNTDMLPVQRRQSLVGGQQHDGLPFYLSWSSNGLGSGGNSIAMKHTDSHPVLFMPMRSFQDIIEETQPNAVKLDIKRGEEQVDWWHLGIPPCTRGIAVEADVSFSHEVINPSLARYSFSPVQLPKLSGWKRAVAVWAR